MQGYPHSDAAELGAMEYFILALVGQAGLNSMYELQQRAGLQPGGIRPALLRLETLGLITRADAGARRRRNLSLTDKGQDLLNQTWRMCMRDYPDSESVLRAACVCLLMGGPEWADMYLGGQAGLRESDAKEKSMEAERLRATRRDPLSTYAWMRSLTEAQRRGAESEAFSQLSLTLKESNQPDVDQRKEH